MKKAELAFTLMHARAVVAEGTLEFLSKKLSELARESSSEQISSLMDLTVQALEQIAQAVEADFLKPRADQVLPEEERKLFADEFRSILEEMKAKIGV